MGLEDKYLDILQNIEGVIASVYREYPEMKDSQAVKSLEALDMCYRALSAKREVKMPENLDDISMGVYELVVEFLDARRSMSDIKSASDIPKRRFGALKETTLDDIYLACVRKVLKSVKRHSKIHGERGYLDFITQFT